MAAWDDDTDVPGYLHLAAQRLSPDDLMVVAHGQDVNEPWTGGMTPLHFAYLANRLDNVRRLVHLGAEETVRDDRGMTPKEAYERCGGFTDHQKRLATILADVSEWWIHRIDGDDEVPLVSPSQLSIGGGTPLHTAARHLGPQEIAFLVRCGVDPNSKDVDGWTALHNAYAAESLDNVEALLAHGADPNLKDEAGQTAAESYDSSRRYKSATKP